MFTLSYTPKSIPEILTDSFDLYKLVFIKFFPISTILAIIFVLSQFTISKIVDGNWAIFSLMFFGQIFGFWLLLVLTCRINQVILNSEKEFKNAYLTAIKKLPICFIVWIIRLLILTAGYVLLAFPGIFMHVLFAFVFFCILFDNDGIFGSFKHSADLVYDNWWRTFGVIIILLIVLMVIFLGINMSIHALVYTIDGFFKGFQNIPEIIWLIDNSLYLSCGIVVAITIPWTLSVMIVQYYDLKFRFLERQKMKQVESIRL